MSKKITELLNGVLSDFSFNDFAFYQDFLSFTARGNLHRFSYVNQFLIYAQKPNASLLVPFSDWERIGRYPKKQSGVTIYPTEKFRVSASHVFDINDTYGKAFPGIWDLKEYDAYGYVYDTMLQNGTEGINFDAVIENHVRGYVKNNATTYGFESNDNESILKFIEECSIYVVLGRCGRDYRISKETEDLFNSVTDYEKFFYIVQSQIQNMSHAILQQISLLASEKAKINRERENKHDESEYVNGTGNSGNEEHDRRRENESTGMSDIRNAYERGTDRSTDGQSGQTDTGVSERELSGAVQYDDGNREDVAVRTETGGRSERSDDSTGRELLETEQAVESDGYDGSSASEEPGESIRGGNSQGRSSVQTDVVEKYSQLSLFGNDVVDDSSEADHVQDDIDAVFNETATTKKYTYVSPKFEKDVPAEYILSVVNRGSGFERGKKRIYYIIKDNIPKKEKAKKIKSEYGQGGAGWPIEGYGLHGYNTYQGKGLRLQWRDEEGEKAGDISWETVTDYITYLINKGEYYQPPVNVETLQESLEHIWKPNLKVFINESTAKAYKYIRYNVAKSDLPIEDKIEFFKELYKGNYLTGMNYRIHYRNRYGQYMVGDERNDEGLEMIFSDGERSLLKIVTWKELCECMDEMIRLGEFVSDDVTIEQIEENLQKGYQADYEYRVSKEIFEKYVALISETKISFKEAIKNYFLNGGVSNEVKVFLKDVFTSSLPLKEKSSYLALIYGTYAENISNGSIFMDEKFPCLVESHANGLSVKSTNQDNGQEEVFYDWLECAKVVESVVSQYDYIHPIIYDTYTENKREVIQSEWLKTIAEEYLVTEKEQFELSFDDVSDETKELCRETLVKGIFRPHALYAYSEAFVKVFTSDKNFDEKVQFVKDVLTKFRSYAMYTVDSGILRPLEKENCIHLSYVPGSIDKNCSSHNRMNEVLEYSQLTHMIGKIVTSEDFKYEKQETVIEKHLGTVDNGFDDYFHKYMEDSVFITYPNEVPAMGQENILDELEEMPMATVVATEDMNDNSIEHKNYKKFCDMFPEIVGGEITYKKYESEGLEPLSVKALSGTDISIMHTYVQNGDLMRDPDIVVRIDHVKQRLEAVSYELSGMGIYETYVDENGEIVKSKQQNDCNRFLATWLGNIKSQGFLDISEQTLETEQMEEIEKELSINELPTMNHAFDFYYSDTWEPNNGGDKSRFEKNLLAIKVLKEIETENRYATVEEQEILSQYVGWGGLSNAFNEKNGNWHKEYKQLREVLTEDEYKAARATVNDSFYTPREVIDGIYAALLRLGYTGGNILEPSMGIGNFYNAMPRELREVSNCYGVEIDSISGRIAKQLHPSANIQICGFEKAALNNNFFTAIIGNVPFGDYKIVDKKYQKHNFLIHDYFFAKALDDVAAGGIICFVTSKGTLDKANAKVRQYIAERAELIGAIRLPANAFLESANTEVTSDIIFLKKKEGLSLDEPDWLNLGYTEDGIPVNQYFIDHPEMMLGKMEKDTSFYGEDSNYTRCTAWEGMDLKQELLKAVEKLPQNIIDIDIEMDEEPEEKGVKTLPATADVKNNTYTVVDNELFYRENALLHRREYNEKMTARIKGMCGIRVALRELINVQLEGCTETVLKEKQNVLNELYDKFVSVYGYISSKENERAFMDDVEYPLLNSL